MPFVKPFIVLAAIALPLTAHAQDVYEGAGATQEMDCAGGTATIRGASNTMTVTGVCKALVIEGAGNRVRVDMAAKGVIRISGASNQVVWRTPDGSKPRVNVAGAGNRVAKAR
jgi:hypothetical protein